MSGSAAQQAAQHIASALVGRHDAVGNHKGAGLDMVCDNTQGNVGLMLLLVFLAGQGAYAV